MVVRRSAPTAQLPHHMGCPPSPAVLAEDTEALVAVTQAVAATASALPTASGLATGPAVSPPLVTALFGCRIGHNRRGQPRLSLL